MRLHLAILGWLWSALGLAPVWTECGLFLIDDRICSTILHSLEQTHCACMWFYMNDYLFLARFFEYPLKWCTYSPGMAGAAWNCCHLGASDAYTIEPCTMSLHAKPRKVYACLTCLKGPPALLAEWLGSLRATAVTWGLNGYRNKSQHRKSTLEKKILLPLLQGFEPVTF